MNMYTYHYMYTANGSWSTVGLHLIVIGYPKPEASLVAATQEAPLLAKPFLAHLTCSEIHAVTQLHWEVLGCFLEIYKQF